MPGPRRPPVEAPAAAAVLVAALALGAAGCGPPLDPDDCALSPAGLCQPYRPQGTLCGLQHTEYWGEGLHPGADCLVGQERSTLVGRSRADTLCPEGWSVGQDVPDDESEGHGWRSCLAEGNEVSSSARLADVPQGSTCGFNSVGDAASTRNLCLGLDPAVDGCPAGYSLRFGADRTYNRKADPESGDTADGTTDEAEAHLLYWCELDEGCTGAGCSSDGAPVLGLVSVDVKYPPHSGLVLTAEIASQSGSLAAAYQDAVAAAADGRPRHRVLGQDLEWDQCPDGLALACAPECTGTGEWAGQDETPLCGSVATPDSWNLGGLCWCTHPDAVVPWSSTDLTVEPPSSRS